MKKIKIKHIGEILQHIYDSEIHIAIGWFWDGGVDFTEWDKNPYMWDSLQEKIMRGTGDNNMCKAFEKICKHLILVYPKSHFTKWFKKKWFTKYD